MRKPTGLLTTICVLAIILGVLGGFGVLTGVVSLVGGEKLQKSMVQTQMSFQGQEFVERQLKMQQEVQEVVNRWKGVNMVMLIVQSVLAVCLFVGGILALRLRPKGRTLLIAAFILGIVFEVARIVPTYFMQRDTMEVMSRQMSQMMESAAPSGQPMPQGMDSMMEVSMTVGFYVGLAVAIGWALLKILYYVLGTTYLQRPTIGSLYAPVTEAIPPGP